MSELRSYIGTWPIKRRILYENFDSVLELVGNTPLLEAGNLERGFGLEVRILLKLEYLNPAGSVKDRIAKAMILDARERGLLQEGAVLIEPLRAIQVLGLLRWRRRLDTG